MLFQMRLVEVTFLAEMTFEVSNILVNFNVRVELRWSEESIRAVLELTDELRSCVIFHVTCGVIKIR